MDREILFRGKRVDNGEWVEGDLRQDKDLKTAYISGYDYYASAEGLQREPYEYEVIPDTVCQYTGLTDRNGRKIFEGDIVKHYNDISNPQQFSLGVIKWNAQGCNFVKCNIDGKAFRVSRKCDYEVCGNIFDNPELLEGGKP